MVRPGNPREQWGVHPMACPVKPQPASLSPVLRARGRKARVQASAIRRQRPVDLLGLQMDARLSLLELPVNSELEIRGVVLEEDRDRLWGPKGRLDPGW